MIYFVPKTENIYPVPNNEKCEMRINFPWKNISNRKWFFRKLFSFQPKLP